MKDKVMVNTLIEQKENTKNLLLIESILKEGYLLPKWEKIKNLVILQKRFLLPMKFNKVSLFRKFSSKNNIEKYCIKDKADNTIASVDLRVYKDCVYIINLNIQENNMFIGALNILLQTAAEKALYNTSNKKLNINLSFSSSINNKIKRIIETEDFLSEKEQSSYEKEILGETFTLDVASSSFWQKKIREMHILINK